MVPDQPPFDENGTNGETLRDCRMSKRRVLYQFERAIGIGMRVSRAECRGTSGRENERRSRESRVSTLSKD